MDNPEKLTTLGTQDEDIEKNITQDRKSKRRKRQNLPKNRG